MVAAQRFADAAQGGQRSLAATDHLQRFAGVARYRAAVAGDQRALGDFLADAGVVFHAAVLDDRGGAVKQEVEVLVGGNAHGQGVGAEHALNAKGRRDGGTGVGAGHADAARVGGHIRIVTSNTIVGGIAATATMPMPYSLAFLIAIPWTYSR